MKIFIFIRPILIMHSIVIAVIISSFFALELAKLSMSRNYYFYDKLSNDFLSDYLRHVSLFEWVFQYLLQANAIILGLIMALVFSIAIVFSALRVAKLERFQDIKTSAPLIAVSIVSVFVTLKLSRLEFDLLRGILGDLGVLSYLPLSFIVWMKTTVIIFNASKQKFLRKGLLIEVSREQEILGATYISSALTYSTFVIFVSETKLFFS